MLCEKKRTECRLAESRLFASALDGAVAVAGSPGSFGSEEGVKSPDELHAISVSSSPQPHVCWYYISINPIGGR